MVESYEKTSLREPGKDPIVITTDREAPNPPADFRSSKVSLVQTVCSAAETPTRAVIEDDDIPKFPPNIDPMVLDEGELKNCVTFTPYGTSYENKYLPVPTFFSIVTTKSLERIPDDIRQVSRESEIHFVEAQLVCPIRAAL